MSDPSDKEGGEGGDPTSKLRRRYARLLSELHRSPMASVSKPTVSDFRDSGFTSFAFSEVYGTPNSTLGLDETLESEAPEENAETSSACVFTPSRSLVRSPVGSTLDLDYREPAIAVDDSEEEEPEELNTSVSEIIKEFEKKSPKKLVLRNARLSFTTPSVVTNVPVVTTTHTAVTVGVHIEPVCTAVYTFVTGINLNSSVTTASESCPTVTTAALSTPIFSLIPPVVPVSAHTPALTTSVTGHNVATPVVAVTTASSVPTTTAPLVTVTTASSVPTTTTASGVIPPIVIPVTSGNNPGPQNPPGMAAPANVSVALPSPAPFSGESLQAGKTFMSKYEMISASWTDETKRDYLNVYLHGPAADWFSSYKNQKGANWAAVPFTDAKKSFFDFCKTRDHTSEGQDTLHGRRQGKQESAVDFYYALLHLVTDLAPKMTEPDRISLFKRGAVDGLQAYLLSWRPKDTTELLEYCKTYDGVQRIAAKEAKRKSGMTVHNLFAQDSSDNEGETEGKESGSDPLDYLVNQIEKRLQTKFSKSKGGRKPPVVQRQGQRREGQQTSGRQRQPPPVRPPTKCYYCKKVGHLEKGLSSTQV